MVTAGPPATVPAERVGAVQRRVLDWYVTQARDLPWRRTRDPYAILVAEVMLQQTQVERVIPKWHAWLEQFPTLADLAAAGRADAIRAWQGLGYNMRAVRLHEIACQVVAELDGELPRSLDRLLALTGIGRYTAGAVACFAYEAPVSMVDTNVRRVLGRVFGAALMTPRTCQALADEVLPRHAAYAWNQALMDIGATVCRADAPLCLVCPLLEVCASAGKVAPRGTRAGKQQASFVGSSRYFRGQILDALRTLPERAALTLEQVGAMLSGGCEAARLSGLVEQLIADGLVEQTADGRVRLPGQVVRSMAVVRYAQHA